MNGYELEVTLKLMSSSDTVITVAPIVTLDD